MGLEIAKASEFIRVMTSDTREAAGVLMYNTETGEERICNGILKSDFGEPVTFYVIGMIPEMSSGKNIMVLVYRETTSKDTTCITTSWLSSLMGISDGSPVYSVDSIRQNRPPRGWCWR